MKKRVFTVTVIVFAFLANVSAQLTVDSTGRVGIGTEIPQFKLDINGDTRVTGGSIYLGDASGFLGTINNDPVRFKVGHDLAGYTGNEKKTNVSFGYIALSSNTVDEFNTAIGWRALNNNTGGYRNTANGASALYGNINGYCNTANGVNALTYNMNGSNNTANGVNALGSNTNGDNNTANGAYALYYNTKGIGNTAIGSGADVITSNLSNATVIGYKAFATSSNQVRIGNNYVTSIGGYAAWTIVSDNRIKKNIRTDVPGLAFINRLQPVTFNLDLDALDGLLKIDKTKKGQVKKNCRRNWQS